MRDTKGRFQKGISGNKGGRPKEDIQLKELARGKTEDVFNILLQIANDNNADAKARITACQEVLNRGWGKDMDSKGMNLNLTLPTPILYDKTVDDIN